MPSAKTSVASGLMVASPSSQSVRGMSEPASPTDVQDASRDSTVRSPAAKPSPSAST